MLAKTLALAEYDVDTAPDGRSALERLRLYPYDLLIADLKMPGLDGLHVIREAKRMKADLPVVIITGYSTETAAIEAVNLGVSGYLTKPFRVPQVLAAAAKAIGEPILDPLVLQLSSVSKSFGERVLLEDVTWQISTGERVGLCGPNGAGKTTLLKMLAGYDKPDEGSIIKPSALTVGYLPQDGLAHAGHSILDEASAAFGDLLQVKAEMHEIEHRLGDASAPQEEHDALLERYSALQDRFRHRRRLQHRSQSGDGAARPRLRRRRVRFADRLALGRMADAAGARQAAARAGRRCCCWTSRRTISTSRRATGSKDISPRTRTRLSSSRTIATSSTPSSRASPT